jgi:leucyl aminopeptidase
MSEVLLTASDRPTTPIRLIHTDGCEAWRATLDPRARAWIESAGFTAKPGQTAWLPDAEGHPATVVAGWDGRDNLATLGGLPFALPPGDYRIDGPVTDLQLLGWALGAYRFDRYRSGGREPARLLVPADNAAQRLQDMQLAITLVRDLINTPAADMLPSHLAAEAAQLAEAHGAECDVIVGEELLDRELNTIHAVGRAAHDEPRLVDFSWGDPAHPEVVLVGKGVCFDSGGLDIKPASGMRTMKKDMGGAAHVLGLAHLVMAEQLPVRLRVLVPAVENAISGNAFRPGDVIATYQGLTVEIDNTDAEGRLILCDALALAAERKPALIVDFATLTGAARTAVGTEIAAMFSNDDAVADALYRAGQCQDDPVWRMPLHEPYAAMLDSKVADVANGASSPYAGAITAALFLQKFVDGCPWVHFDIMAYNVRARPGRPEGGEAMGVRAVFDYLRERFPKP